MNFPLSSIDLDLSEVQSSDVGLPASCSGSLNKVRLPHVASPLPMLIISTAAFSVVM